MKSITQNRQKFRSSPPQPIDRHLSEIGETDGTVYINAGIDSTCSKKRSRTIHKLIDGIVVSTTQTGDSNFGHDDSTSLLLNTKTDEDRTDVTNNSCCVHYGNGNKIIKDI
ncbi:unnamed protein product [Rotaria magnacalcarata]|uniref:Uncharacterized protein n=1 Tax=Rotaria magnacalcarata TaxID=392030 RepID=A0A815QR96_9BILA|nr:unnamed protein product [Rotaria magnacalcarata]CAF1466682.1 unnamed protein product [Rotaria magnacalcarata]CAF2100766.1 unnamed protein product [Rotaria magnacalcarata]CAF3789331.1 unnamed protein product [Rotaria magnacalcarata]CAF3803966.1 unnamed protein product [Rotaria magnacalcarata]